MGGGPDDRVVPSRIEPSGASEDASADRSASDSVAHDTAEVPVVTELDDASSQSPRPDKKDAVNIENHEDTEVDDPEDDTATVTGKEQEPANVVATEVQTVKACKRNPSLDPEKMCREPETRPISQEQLVAEVKGIYAGLVMVETKCIKVDNDQMPPRDGPLDITKYLLMIPDAKLILLQDGSMYPEGVVRTWYIKVQKDATEGDEKPLTPDSTENLPATSQDLSATPVDSSTNTDSPSTTPKDCPTTPEEDATVATHSPAHPDVPEKAAPQVGSPEDYLRGFQVALELRAKENGWPEWEQLAAASAAEIGEEDRKKVIEGRYFLDIGYDLVDQLMRDLETAKTKAEKKEAEAKAKAEKEAEAKAKADQEAAQAKAEEEESQAKEDDKDSNPDPEATSTCVDETPGNPQTQSRPSNDTQQAVPEEPSPEESKAALEEESFEQIAPQEADIASEKVDVTSKGVAPEIAPEEADVGPEVSGNDTADAVVDAVTLDEKTKSKSEEKPEIKLPMHVDMRPLNDKSRYRKVGNQWWVLISGRWIPSLNAAQYVALLALHRTNLHEHHDFFSASQHPAASRALQRLAKKYAMPARMWRHGVHSYLEVLRHRLPESHEFMDDFIILSYRLMSFMDETVPRFRSTWVECKGDLARYGFAIEDKDMLARERWRNTSKEEYTRVLIDDPTVGRLYHYLAILVRPRSSPDKNFHANVSKLFYYTKSLVVKTPFYTGRDSVLTVVKPIVDRNKKAAEEPASVPQRDQDQLLTAVVHLILASLEPETLRKHGYQDSRKDHLQAVYAALEKIKVGGPVKTPRIRPSAQLGLLLCQLLLGMPLVDKRWSPMMAAWAPDLVTAEDRADSNAMANARDIHDATIELINTMVPYLLEDADTRDLRVWEFIYVILAFMRSLKTRPALLEWLGPAFHAEMIAPYLNMLLREDETRGCHALESASRSELVTIRSPLNMREKLGKYRLSTEDNIRNYYREKEEKRKAKRAESTVTVGEVTAEEAVAKEAVAEAATAQDATATPDEGTVTTDDDAVTTDDHTVTTGDATVTTEDATVTTQDTTITPKGTQTTAEESMAATEDTTTSDAAHEMDGNTKIPGAGRLYANPLPEHILLSGLFFAREADPEPCDEPLENPAEDPVVVACPAAAEAIPAAVQAAEEPAVQSAEKAAVEQAQEISLTDSDTDSEAGGSVLRGPELENEAADEILTSPVPKSESEAQEEQRTDREAVEAPLAEVEMKETGTEEASLTEVEREKSEDKDARQQDTQTKEEDSEKTQQEDEQKVRESEEAPLAEEKKKEREAKEEEERKRREAEEAEEAEVRRQEGLLRDPPLFPNGWLQKSKYDFDETRVCDYVQSFEMCNDRSIQTLCLAVQLLSDFFTFEFDEEKRIWISVPGTSSVPKPDPNKKMPEIVERDGGIRVVYVDPSSYAAEIEEKERMAREEERRKEEEMQKEQAVQEEKETNAEATTEVATVVDEKTKGDAEEQPAQSERPTDPVNAEGAPEAVNIPAGVPSTVSEDGDDKAISAYDMELRKAITAAEKPSSTHDAEPTEAEAETTLPVQDVNDSQGTKGSGAGLEADAAAADEQAAATVPAEGADIAPQASAEFTKDELNKMPKTENPANAIKRWRTLINAPGADKEVDEDGWTHVSDESYEEPEKEPTIQTAQVETRSMISCLFFAR